MKQIEYEGVKIAVPESWDDITLGLYDTFYHIKTQDIDDKIKIVASACQTTPELLRSWPVEVFTRMVGYVEFLFTDNAVAPVSYTEINGTKYYVPIEDKLTLGAYIDVMEVQKQNAGVLSNVLAIVCRPQGEAYDYLLNEERATLFASQPVSKFLGVLGFFLRYKNVLTATTQGYNELSQLVNLLPRTIPDLLKRGTGIKWSRIWLITKYLILIKSLHYQLRKYSHFYNTGAIKT